MKRILTTLLLFMVLAVTATAQDYSLPRLSTEDTPAKREAYTVLYDTDTRCPVWVAWHLTAERAGAGDVSRKGEEFQPDLSIEDGALPSDYSRNGLNLDRGHMCPAADNKHSATAMKESFLMTNICPQNHSLNEGLWAELEKRCRVYAKMYGEVWICCGPIFDSNPVLLNERVSVPSAFFKVILAKAKGAWHTIGFVMRNEATDKEENIFNYRLSVSEIEEMTGLTFFDALPQTEAKDETDTKTWDIRWKK